MHGNEEAQADAHMLLGYFRQTNAHQLMGNPSETIDVLAASLRTLGFVPDKDMNPDVSPANLPSMGTGINGRVGSFFGSGASAKNI